MKKSLRRYIVQSFALALLTVGVYKVASVYPLLKVGARYRAKMGCSCRYLSEQSQEFCEKWTHNPQVPKAFVPMEFVPESSAVRVGVWGWRFEARFDPATQSCTLGPE